MNIFNPTFTISKRQLGLFIMIMGILGLIAMFLYDQIGLSDPGGGFGPMQKLGALGAMFLVGVGISLVPLGNDPA